MIMKKAVLLLIFVSLFGHKVSAEFFLRSDINFAIAETNSSRNLIRLSGLAIGALACLVTYRLVSDKESCWTITAITGIIPTIVGFASAEFTSTNPISFACRATKQISSIISIIEPYRDIINWKTQGDIDRFVLGNSENAETPFHDATTCLVKAVQQINTVIGKINQLHSDCLRSTNGHTTAPDLAPAPFSILTSKLSELTQQALSTTNYSEAIQVAIKLKEYSNTARTALVDALAKLRQSPQLVQEQALVIAERNHSRELEKLHLKHRLRKDEIQTIADASANANKLETIRFTNEIKKFKIIGENEL